MLSAIVKEEKFLWNDDNAIKLPQTARKLRIRFVTLCGGKMKKDGKGYAR